jgi:CheY-like chemotaxis protein
MLRTYLGQGGAVRTPQPLAEELRALVQLMQPLLSASVRLELECAADSPTCTIDRTEFQQLVRSVLSNASEAVIENGGGTVSVSLRRVREAAQDGMRDWAELEIRDNGIGMDAATLERIFDPFFTTKFTGRGLGLSTAQGIVRASQGTIVVDSQRGQGTRVTIRLPASSGPESERAETTRGPITDTALSMVKAAKAAQPSAPPRHRVLLVDDDALVRSATVRLLRRQGCEVLQASDGREALSHFTAHAGEIDCVLLDLSMPGMDGWEVLAALRAHDPNAYVVLASGYDVDQLRGEQREILPNGWLQKPYSLGALSSILSR